MSNQIHRSPFASVFSAAIEKWLREISLWISSEFLWVSTANSEGSKYGGRCAPLLNSWGQDCKCHPDFNSRFYWLSWAPQQVKAIKGFTVGRNFKPTPVTKHRPEQTSFLSVTCKGLRTLDTICRNVRKSQYNREALKKEKKKGERVRRKLSLLSL